MAISEVTVCSNACLLVGADPIAAFTEGERGRICGALYPSVRDEVLRSHPWTCATKRVSLDPDAASPAFEWAYQFTKPADWLRTNWVGLDIWRPVEYRMEGGKILANDNPLPLCYVYRETDPNAWDSLLLMAVQYAMAKSIAFPLTKSASMLENMTKLYLEALRQARVVNGIETPPEGITNGRLRTSRTIS